jgi:hypothetical protein
MPIPGNIPPPTPAQLNLRIDIPEIIALSPHIPVDEEPESHSPELALPYHIVTPLPLPVTALSRTNEHEDDDGFDANDGFDVNDGLNVNNGCDVNDNGKPNWRGGDHVNSEEVGQALWPIHTVASSESDTPVAAPRTTDMRASSQSDATAPAPAHLIPHKASFRTPLRMTTAGGIALLKVPSQRRLLTILLNNYTSSRAVPTTSTASKSRSTS